MNVEKKTSGVFCRLANTIVIWSENLKLLQINLDLIFEDFHQVMLITCLKFFTQDHVFDLGMGPITLFRKA